MSVAHGTMTAMRLVQIAETSAAVAATRSRLAKREALAATLRAAADEGPDADAVATRYLAGQLRQRRTGLGWRSLADLPGPVAEPSLTLVEVDDESFTVSLIPETLARTTLGFKQPGDPVNLEVDVIAKYVERLLAPDSSAGPTSSLESVHDSGSTGSEDES